MRKNPRGVTGYLIEKAIVKSRSTRENDDNEPVTVIITDNEPDITANAETPLGQGSPSVLIHTIASERNDVMTTERDSVQSSYHEHPSPDRINQVCDNYPGRTSPPVTVTDTTQERDTAQSTSTPTVRLQQAECISEGGAQQPGVMGDDLVESQMLRDILCEIRMLSRKIDSHDSEFVSRASLRKEMTELEKKISPGAAKARSADTAKQFPWLLTRGTGSEELGFCSTCIANKATVSAMRGQHKALRWTTEGVSLKKNRLEIIARHAATAVHKACMQVPEERDRIQSLFGLQCEKHKRLDDNLTRDMLMAAYHNLLLGHSYAAFESLMNRLFSNMMSTKETFSHIDWNTSRKAAASAIDVIYEVLRKSHCSFLKSVNPTTGRLRHFHISADKVTAERTSRQVVNIRFIDVDGAPKVTNLSVDVIRNRASEADAAEGVTHESDAVGCLEHICDVLTKSVLDLSPRSVGTMCFSMSSDKEAVYAGQQSGVAVRWRERFNNNAFLHLLDRAHKVELWTDSVFRKDEFQWARVFIRSNVDKVVGAINRSSKLMRLARRIDPTFTVLYRNVDTRFIEYTVLAINSIIKQYGNVVMTIENDGRRDNDPDKLQALDVLCDIDFIPTALVLLYVLDIVKKVSKAAQKATYSLWDDRKAIDACRLALQEACDGKSNPLIRKHGKEFRKGRFNGFDFENVSLLVTSHKRSTRIGSSYHSTLKDALKRAMERQAQLAQALLDELDAFLDVTEVEDKMMKIFDIPTFPLHDKLALKQFRNKELREVVKFFCTHSNIRFPGKHSSMCRHEKECRCVEDQYIVFKNRVSGQIQLRAEWYADDNGVKILSVGFILHDFLRPSSQLHVSIPDVIELMEIAVLLCRSQSDTERTGKLVKDLSENRFGGKFNELKPLEKDRCAKEVYIRELGLELHDLPIDAIKEEWSKFHYGVLKKRGKKTPAYLRKHQPSKVKFMTSYHLDQQPREAGTTSDDVTQEDRSVGSPVLTSDNNEGLAGDSTVNTDSNLRTDVVHASSDVHAHSSSGEDHMSQSIGETASEHADVASDDNAMEVDDFVQARAQTDKEVSFEQSEPQQLRSQRQVDVNDSDNDPDDLDSPIASGHSVELAAVTKWKQSSILTFIKSKQNVSKPPKEPEAAKSPLIDLRHEKEHNEIELRDKRNESGRSVGSPTSQARPSEMFAVEDDTRFSEMSTTNMSPGGDDNDNAEQYSFSDAVLFHAQQTPRGMINRRNDCYLITVLQILPLLRIKRGGSGHDHYANLLINNLRDCYNSEICSDPGTIKGILAKKFEIFHNDEQQDSSEALECIFKVFLEGGMNIDSARIDTTTTLKCRHCSYSSDKHVNQHQLHLWCNKRSTVYECLSDYCSATILDDFSCGNDECSGRGGAHTTSISCEPEVMVLNMQRPDYDRRQKIALDCPLEGLRIPGGNKAYHLVGAILHWGTREHGHYQCLIRRGEFFFKCDDEKVSNVNQETVKELLSYNACILIYRMMQSWR
ncbi:uncharacterized protein LOC122365592 isoform X3 [Amphibalanus amphitrite]|nr:uncharacterized protein LOC122365592 isoform X3 [Amphibalanus amphitrite]